MERISDSVGPGATRGEDVLMRWLSAPIALAAVALLAGCGSAKSPVAVAAAKSSKAPSMHVLTLLQEQVGQGSAVQLTMAGDFNNVTQRSSLVINLGDLAQSFGDTGASAQLFDGQEISDSSGSTTAFYLDVPFYSQSIPAAKAWLMFDLATIGQREDAGLLEIAELNSTEPRGQLAVLEAGAGTFANLGQDDINGVLATHYQGKIDLQKALRKLADPAKAEIQNLLIHSNGTLVPYNVWVGPNGLVRRVEMQIAGNVGAEGLTLGLISDFSNYGKPVYVNLPPAGQVTDLTVGQMAQLTAVLESK
jgi:hypothetical protein